MSRLARAPDCETSLIKRLSYERMKYEMTGSYPDIYRFRVTTPEGPHKLRSYGKWISWYAEHL